MVTHTVGFIQNKVSVSKPALLDYADPTQRYRLLNDFTRELTDLCRKHGVAIYGGQLIPMNMDWHGPDAEKWEQYALNEDDFLVKGFWNQHPTVIER